MGGLKRPDYGLRNGFLRRARPTYQLAEPICNGRGDIRQMFHGPVGDVRIMAEEFSLGDWIDRLDRALSGLAEAQEPDFSGYREFRTFLPAIPGVEDGGSRGVGVKELGELYARARYSQLRCEEAWYEALNAALDPVRHILLRHPTIAWVVGPIIGRDNLYMQVLNSGGSTTPADLAAVLMTRAAEHSGNCFRKAVGELHAFLVGAAEEDGAALPDGLDRGYEALLFHGSVVEERIDVAVVRQAVTLRRYRSVAVLVERLGRRVECHDASAALSATTIDVPQRHRHEDYACQFLFQFLISVCPLLYPE